MAEYGFTLSGEEHPPERLVELAERAEEAGFDFVMMSDHYHPWTTRQGESPFVWAVLGAVARATSRVRVGTGVTCPLIRMHPAIVAQAAATTARLLGDRFLFGIGSGENLNEHVVGAPWPPPEARLEMLEEAIGILRSLWEGKEVTHRGRHYTVDEATLFTVPESPPPILVAAGGKSSATLAARCGDGMVGVTPERELLDTFAKAGGRDKPRFGQMTVCWGRNEKEARATALEFWPNSGLSGNVPWEVKTTALFDDVCALVREEDIESVTCGPDVGRFVESVRRYEKAGYDHVWIHQVGPDQEGFLTFAERELLPKLR
jgi:G6PDH family F420-dependent oxidoreductase